MRSRFLDIPIVRTEVSFFLDVGECNELSGTHSNSVQPFKLFFIAKEGLRYNFADEKPKRPRFVEIVRNSRNKLDDCVQSPFRKFCENL